MGARGSAARPVHISSAGRRGAALRGSTARRAPRPREQPSLDAAHPPRRWGPRPASAPCPPRSPMWMMESARTDTHWHIQGRSHSVSASMSPGRVAHPPGPGERPRAARSGEAPVRVQSRAAPREPSPPVRLSPRARPCALRPAPAPVQPSPARSGSRSGSAGGCGGAGGPSPSRRGGGGPRRRRRRSPRLGRLRRRRRRWRRQPGRHGGSGLAVCLSPGEEPNCRGRPLPSPSPSTPLPLPSLPASLPSALLSTT